MAGKTANAAMMDRARAALFESPGLEWEQLVSETSLAGDEKRAGRIIADLVETGEIVRCFEGGEALYRFYLSEEAHDLQLMVRVGCELVNTEDEKLVLEGEYGADDC